MIPTPRKPNSEPRVVILVINYKLPLRISYVGARENKTPDRVPVARKKKANKLTKKAANLQKKIEIVSQET